MVRGIVSESIVGTAILHAGGNLYRDVIYAANDPAPGERRHLLEGQVSAGWSDRLFRHHLEPAWIDGVNGNSRLPNQLQRFLLPALQRQLCRCRGIYVFQPAEPNISPHLHATEAGKAGADPNQVLASGELRIGSGDFT